MGRRAATEAVVANLLRSVGYIRVSTDEQGLGAQAQRASLQRWSRAHGIRLVAVYADLGLSGAAPIEKRTGLTAALAAIGARRAGVLVVAKRDRLARDTILAAIIEKTVEGLGATLQAVDGAGNGHGPEAILMRRIVDAFAEYERLVIQMRTRAALAVKRSRRERISREPPYWWRLSADGSHIEPNPHERVAVALAQRLRRSGMSLRRIAHRLTRRGHMPRSAKCWHPQTIGSMTCRGYVTLKMTSAAQDCVSRARRRTE